MGIRVICSLPKTDYLPEKEHFWGHGHEVNQWKSGRCGEWIQRHISENR